VRRTENQKSGGLREPLAPLKESEHENGEHMEPVIELLEELNSNDTDAKLKLLALVISEYMLNADVTGFGSICWSNESGPLISVKVS
jgi:hypothetical protein